MMNHEFNISLFPDILIIGLPLISKHSLTRLPNICAVLKDWNQ